MELRKLAPEQKIWFSYKCFGLATTRIEPERLTVKQNRPLGRTAALPPIKRSWIPTFGSWILGYNLRCYDWPKCAPSQWERKAILWCHIDKQVYSYGLAENSVPHVAKKIVPPCSQPYVAKGVPWSTWDPQKFRWQAERAEITSAFHATNATVIVGENLESEHIKRKI